MRRADACRHGARLGDARGGLFCLLCKLHVNAAAQHFCIGIGCFPEKIFIVGTNGEQRGIDSRQCSAKSLDFVPAQPHGDVYALFFEVQDAPFDPRNIVIRFDHAVVFDRTYENYTPIRAFSTMCPANKRHGARIR